MKKNKIFFYFFIKFTQRKFIDINTLLLTKNHFSECFFSFFLFIGEINFIFVKHKWLKIAMNNVSLIRFLPKQIAASTTQTVFVYLI